MLRIRNQKRNTLWPIIRKRIAPGSRVHTDGHKSYVGLSRMPGVYPRFKVVKVKLFQVVNFNTSYYNVFSGSIM